MSTNRSKTDEVRLLLYVVLLAVLLLSVYQGVRAL